MYAPKYFEYMYMACSINKTHITHIDALYTHTRVSLVRSAL